MAQFFLLIMELPARYPYNPTWRMIIVCGGFFGFCSVVAANEALDNKAGVIINGIIRLGPAGAKVFLWSLAASGAGFVLMALMLALRRIASHQVFELGPNALLLPHGFLQRQKSRIAYSDIRMMSEARVSGQTFLYLITSNRRFTINVSLFPDKGSYIAVRDFLLSRVSPLPKAC